MNHGTANICAAASFKGTRCGTMCDRLGSVTQANLSGSTMSDSMMIDT
jgi:hypothetical protein